MKCPACQSERIEVAARVGWAEAFGTPRRHYHGTCTDCGAELWWDNSSIPIAPQPSSRPHSCAMRDRG